MNSRKQIIVFLTFAVGIVLLLVLVFGHGSKKGTTTAKKGPTDKSITLTDYANKDTTVVLTTDGIINGDDVHRAFRFTITRNNRRIDLIQGYQGHIIKTENFENNSEAYNIFIRALARTGFGKVRPGIIDDERGICATGRRYIYEVFDDSNKQTSRTWGASCTKGTSMAVSDSVLRLFQAQITDYSKFSAGVHL